MKTRTVGAAFAACLSLGSCGGGSDTPPSAPHVAGDIPIPGITADTNFSFDLGVVVYRPPVAAFYAFTDRNNKSVDRIDIPTQTLAAQITGSGATAFTGVGANNGVSGPDGLNDIAAGKMYAGDVNSVKIINTATNTVTGVINGGMLAASGVRADEGCVGSGPAAGTYIISSPEAAVPFMTVINTATDSVIATITFNDLVGRPSAGIELGGLRLHQGHVEPVGHPGAAGFGLEAERAVEAGQLAGLDKAEAQLGGRLVMVELDDGVELLAEQVGHHADPGRAASVGPVEDLDPLQIAGPFRPAFEVGGGVEAGGRWDLDPDIADAFDRHRRTLATGLEA